MNATMLMKSFKRMRISVVTTLGISLACMLHFASAYAQSQPDILYEIDSLEAEAAALHTAAQQLAVTLQSMSPAAGRDVDRQQDVRSPGDSTREPYITQCCGSAYGLLAMGVARLDNNFQALNRTTREYQRRALIHAFGTAEARKNALVQAMAGLTAAPDLTGTLRSVENQLLPSLQSLLPALEALHSEATSQLANAPFYLLSVESHSGPFSAGIQATPGDQVVFQVMIDAALTPQPVLPSSMLTVFASVPHRWDNSIAFQPPMTLAAGQQATGTFVADIAPGIAATDIPVTFRVTGDFPAGQHRGLSRQVMVRVRNPN